MPGRLDSVRNWDCDKENRALREGCPPADSGQGELFGDDSSQRDAADGEPLFWSANTSQDCSAADFVQGDAAD